MLLILATELAVSTTLAGVQIRARRKMVRKWCEGSLSLEELHRLKQAVWFRRAWRPTTEKVAKSKKDD